MRSTEAEHRVLPHEADAVTNAYAEHRQAQLRLLLRHLQGRGCKTDGSCNGLNAADKQCPRAARCTAGPSAVAQRSMLFGRGLRRMRHCSLTASSVPLSFPFLARFAAGSSPSVRRLLAHTGCTPLAWSSCVDCCLERQHYIFPQRGCKARYRFSPLSGFLRPRSCVFSDMGGGGLGMTPAWPSSLPTVCDGCAPTDIQYLHRMIFSLAPSCIESGGCGWYDNRLCIKARCECQDISYVVQCKNRAATQQQCLALHCQHALDAIDVEAQLLIAVLPCERHACNVTAMCCKRDPTTPHI